MFERSGELGVHLREALALSEQVLDRPRDERLTLRLAVEVQALIAAIQARDLKPARQ